MLRVSRVVVIVVLGMVVASVLGTFSKRLGDDTTRPGETTRYVLGDDAGVIANGELNLAGILPQHPPYGDEEGEGESKCGSWWRKFFCGAQAMWELMEDLYCIIKEGKRYPC